MDQISTAIVGIQQAASTLVNASKSLAVHASLLVQAIRVREESLIVFARAHPDCSPEEIIAMVNRATEIKPQSRPQQ